MNEWMTFLSTWLKSHLNFLALSDRFDIPKDKRQLHWIAVYALLNWRTFGIKFRGFQTLHRDFRSSLKDARQLHWIAVYALLNWGTFGIKFRGFQTLHRDFRSSLNDVHIACGFHTEVHTEGTVCPQYVRALLKIAIFKLFYFIKFESDLYERFAVCRWNPNIV